MRLVDRDQCSCVLSVVWAPWAVGCALWGPVAAEPPCRAVAAPGRMLDLSEFRSAIF